MIESTQIQPGVTLRCCQDTRFKQSRLSIQFVRPMCSEEAAMNSLIPAVLLRGTRKYPDLRAITMHLDDLYGAAVGDAVRRIGDYHAAGLYCTFTEDRFAMEGDRIAAPMMDFIRQLLLEPVLEDGVFSREFVESERKNLIADMDSQRNDKHVYAAARLMRTMCAADSYGIPRLGTREQAQAITADRLYAHYKKVLLESPVEIFYVGSCSCGEIAELLQPIFHGWNRQPMTLPAQTPFCDGGPVHTREEMDISQSRICMGFVTPTTNLCPEFAAMQVLNTLFGSGMTGKLFMNVREKMSLCYSIGSDYYSTKGIVTVSAGIDADKEETVRQEILHQLELCREGEISPEELTAAKEAILSALRMVPDSPGAIEGFYGTAALSGMPWDLEEYRRRVEAVTAEDAAREARKLQYHSDFFLKGVQA